MCNIAHLHKVRIIVSRTSRGHRQEKFTVRFVRNRAGG